MHERPSELRIASVSKLETGEGTTVPLYLCRVSAGFPSPADGYVESNIDLNDWLIRNKLATYIVRVEGDSMVGEIHPDDRLIVDRSLEPRHRDVVIACRRRDASQTLGGRRRGPLPGRREPSYAPFSE